MGKVYEALKRAEEQRSKLRADRGGAPGRRPAIQSDLTTLEPERPSGAVPVKPTDEGRGHHLSRDQEKRLSEEAGALNKRRISLLHPDSFVAEQFRSLRTRIESIAAQQPLRTIAVTSALPSEGKTTSAVNLALVTAMSLQSKVILVDCDLREPTVHRSLGISAKAGLGEVLAGTAEISDAIARVYDTGLDVMPVAQRPPNPSELLSSGRMRDVLEELSTNYDRVILDVPPTLGLPDAKVISELCDGVVFVVRADVTAREEVRSALEILDRRRVLGLVLNWTQTKPEHYGYYGR
ncbi:MAG: CpsD/CapB family tyrosine-protein kinase [Myxococcales bacterium]|nr:CpsD/CapB family tyrosine-protein kinase [Myxococcales bacterium]